MSVVRELFSLIRVNHEIQFEINYKDYLGIILVCWIESVSWDNSGKIHLLHSKGTKGNRNRTKKQRITYPVPPRSWTHAHCPRPLTRFLTLTRCIKAWPWPELNCQVRDKFLPGTAMTIPRGLVTVYVHNIRQLDLDLCFSSFPGAW